MAHRTESSKQGSKKAKRDNMAIQAALINDPKVGIHIDKRKSSKKFFSEAESSDGDDILPKRIREIDRLAGCLQVLIREDERQNLSLEKVPALLHGWQSPWKGKLTGGELISKSEEELYDMALRIRERFLELLSDEYHSDVYPIKATQVPRASASAVAFGTGLFSKRGSLGAGRHRVFAVTSENCASDILLRVLFVWVIFCKQRKILLMHDDKKNLICIDFFG